MPLQTQIVSLPLGRGVNTKMDPKIVDPASAVLALENGYLLTSERVTKRNGFNPLPTAILGGGSIAGGSGLFSFRQELLLQNGPSLYSLSPGAAGWVSKGFAPPCIVTGKNIARNAYAQTVPDSATVQGVTLYAWEDSRGGVRASVIDDTSGAFLISDLSINSSGATPRCVAFSGANSTLVVVYRVAGTIRSKVYSPQSNSFGSENTVESDIANANPSPLDVIPAGNAAIVAYGTGAACKLFYLLATGMAAGLGTPYPSPVTVGSNPANALTIVYDASTGNLYGAYSTSTPALRGWVLNSNFGTQQADKAIDATATVVRNITGYMDPSTVNRIIWFYEFVGAGSLSYNAIVWTLTFTSGGIVGTPAVLKRSVGLASKAWLQGGVIYMAVAYQTLLNPTYFVVDQNGNIIAKMLTGQGGGLTAKQSTLPQVRQYANSLWKIPLGILDRLVSQNSTVAYLAGVWETALDFSGILQHFYAQLGQNLHLIGGYLYDYDGTGVVEHGFHVPPENVSVTQTTGGSLTLLATYGWAVMWEWQDDQGQIHRSNTQTGSFALTGSNDALTLTIPTLRLTAKSQSASTPRGEVWIVVYRTQANGTTYYRDTSITAPTLNNSAADSITYTIIQADSAVAANEIAYNNANVAGLSAAGAATIPVLGNDCPPACSLVAVGKNRVFLNSSEFPGQVWYSQKWAPNLGVAFSGILVQIVPQDVSHGVETGLAVMDDKLFIFRRGQDATGSQIGAILRMGGDGPDATGQNNSFQIPQVISSDVGAINQSNIALGAEGLYFQGAKGIILLDRSEQVSYIGAPVEGYLTGASPLTITAVTLAPLYSQVRFLTSQGTTLIYDTFQKQWYTHIGQPGVDADMSQSSYVYLRANGQVWQELQPTVPALDNGSWNPLRVRTAWIKIAQLAGYGRTKRLVIRGDYRSPHALTIRVAYDYQPYFTDVFNGVSAKQINATTFGGTSPYGGDSPSGGTGDGTYVWEVSLRHQKCEAFQVEIQDSPPGGNAALDGGLSLTHLAAVVGVKAGLRKPQITQRVG
jgi:hypothetical protein